MSIYCNFAFRALALWSEHQKSIPGPKTHQWLTHVICKMNTEMALCTCLFAHLCLYDILMFQLPLVSQWREDLPLIWHIWTLCKDTADYCLCSCFYAPNGWPEFLTEYWTISFQKWTHFATTCNNWLLQSKKQTHYIYLHTKFKIVRELAMDSWCKGSGIPLSEVVGGQ